MFDRLRSAFGSPKAEESEDSQRLRGAFRTDAGMLCIWRPGAFVDVDDYESWERQLCSDADILRHIAAGDFVPLNIGVDGTSEVEVRTGSADCPAVLSERERTYLDVSSRPYRFTSDGVLCLGGIEHVQGTPDGNVGCLAVSPGEQAVVLHLVGWDREPGMLTATGSPSPEALPDFVVTVNPAGETTAYRTGLETFE